MANINFNDVWYELAPPYLTTNNAERYMYTMQVCSDLLLEKCSQAVTIRLPGVGDPSNVPYLAFDRQLMQGANETQAAFIQRLRGAFNTWALVGSRVAVLQQLQIYLQGFYPGVAATYPELTIVGGSYDTVTTWDQLYIGDAIGAVPTKTTIAPSNFNWDGKANFWRNWLVMFMSLVPTGQSGTGGETSTAAAGSLYQTNANGAHIYGQNTSGVWVPGNTGTAVNHPWINLINLSGLTSANVGQWITISGSSHPSNNGTFQIVSVSTTAACVIANPAGVALDSGPLTWSIGAYPFVGPGPVWGAPGYNFGTGELQTPPIDTGATQQGIWKPSLLGAYQPSMSWGLTCSSLLIQTIRSILKTWKAGATYYQSIIVAFDGGDGTASNAYSPNSTSGSGNPDGTFGSRGKNVGGVWEPTRLINSPFDCYCQGTGTWSACSVPNIT